MVFNPVAFPRLREWRIINGHYNMITEDWTVLMGARELILDACIVLSLTARRPQC
jgi:hypothetical protein